MDLEYSDEYDAFREEVRTFVSEHWPARGGEAKLPRKEQVLQFRLKAIEHGFMARSIPKKYGGSEQEADVFKANIIREELRQGDAPGEMTGAGPGMLVPTLLDRGAEWQKEKWIRPTLLGEIIWCQGYSEPGSGSDLASIATRGQVVGDEWVINGQKIWTSGAHRADFMFCLCRTEPDASKHAGISYLLIDMKQPGIEISPLRQMTGSSDFNQVFFDDAKTPTDWIVGKRGEGWNVSRTTLKHERNMIGSTEQMTRTLAALLRLAKRTTHGGGPALQDPGIRQRLGVIEGYIKAQEATSYYQLSCAARGKSPGRITAMNKLIGTNVGQEIAKLVIDLLGDEGLMEAGERVYGEDPKGNSGWIAQYMGSVASAIAGGSSNIQRNVIAERVLGLPRDYYATASKG